jgi:hypothetical protein
MTDTFDPKMVKALHDKAVQKAMENPAMLDRAISELYLLKLVHLVDELEEGGYVIETITVKREDNGAFLSQFAGVEGALDTFEFTVKCSRESKPDDFNDSSLQQK